MGLIIAMIIGGLAGWLGSVAMRALSPQGILLNAIIGILGSLIGAFFIGSQIGGGNLLDSRIDPKTVLVSLVGAVLLLGIVYFARGRKPRL